RRTYRTMRRPYTTVYSYPPESPAHHTLTLSLPRALPICKDPQAQLPDGRGILLPHGLHGALEADVLVVLPERRLVGGGVDRLRQDRKSTRLNSSHVKISYAVFCLKKKKTKRTKIEKKTRK